MNKIILYLLLISQIVGCSKKLVTVECDLIDINCDSEFCEDFNDALIKIQLSERGENISFYQKQSSVFYLESITMTKSKINSLETPVYDNKRDLEEDLIKWVEWFNLNRCRFNKLEADSIILYEMHKVNN